MSKISLTTLAHNAARCKQRLERQTKKLADLNTQLIGRVGTGGQTIITTLGQVVVSAQTFDREGRGFFIQFNENKFNELDPLIKAQLTQLGVVEIKKQTICGQAPRVSYRFNTNV